MGIDEDDQTARSWEYASTQQVAESHAAAAESEKSSQKGGVIEGSSSSSVSRGQQKDADAASLALMQQLQGNTQKFRMIKRTPRWEV